MPVLDDMTAPAMNRHLRSPDGRVRDSKFFTFNHRRTDSQPTATATSETAMPPIDTRNG
jgi:hypothetical protein